MKCKELRHLYLPLCISATLTKLATVSVIQLNLQKPIKAYYFSGPHRKENTNTEQKDYSLTGPKVPGLSLWPNVIAKLKFCLN